MDDRFRSEDMSFNNKPSSRPPHITKSNSLGDFSENIDSVQGKTASGAPVVNSTSKVKKFQVHLPDDADLIPDIVPSKPTDSGSVLKDVTGRQYLESIQNKTVESTRVVNPAEIRMQAEAAPPQPQKTGAPAVKRTAVNANNNTRANAPKVTKTTSVKQENAKKKLTQEQKKKIRMKKKYNFINSVLVTCVCVIFITILTVTASTVAMTTINDILVIDKGENSDYVAVNIYEGYEYEEVFDALKDAGLIKQPLITNLFCKFRHYDEIEVYDENGNYVETRRIKYEPGTYYLDADAGVESILEEMMASRGNSKDTARLTFPEGWTIAQIFEKIEKYQVCDAAKLYANLEIVGNQYDFISSITAENGRYLIAEGYLFPDTYDFYIGENASSVIKKLLNNFEAKWKEEYNDRLKELDMTMDEILTIASIIQREAKDTTQMDDISSVIHNRLKDSATYPSIDMNSTKDYVLSLKEYNLFSDFYYNLYLNSYNTYSNPGLPPGPICNPGAAAIRAALYPSDTDYCFFCHDDNGTIYLASTAAEHQKNTEKVLYGN